MRVGETEQTTRERDNERERGRERGRECVRDPTLESVKLGERERRREATSKQVSE